MASDMEPAMKLYDSLDTTLNNYLSKLEEKTQPDKSLMKRLKRIAINVAYIKLLAGKDLIELNLDANQSRILIDTFDLMYPLYVAVHSPDNEQKIPSELALVIKDIMENLTLILNLATFDFIKVCHLFLDLNGLKVIFQFLTNSVLINAYVKLAERQKNNPDFTTIDNSMRQMVSVIILLGRVYDQHLNKWKEVNAVRFLLDYLEKTKDIRDNKLICCMSIAFIATDDDIESLPQLKEILPVICDLVGKIARVMGSDDLKRGFVDLDETTVMSSECGSSFLDNDNATTSVKKNVAMIYIEPTEWSLINLIKALFHLSVSDKMKYDIYNKNHMDKYLRLIIIHGNEVEQEYALKLLMQLCFDSQIKDKVSEDKELVDKIKSLKGSSSQDNSQVQKISTNILWMIEKQSTPEPIQPEPIKVPKVINATNLLIGTANEVSVAAKYHMTEAKQVNKNEKHIMISYNRDSRELCLKIKKELEEMGHKVWIDVESISGSSMESMAKAVEESTCILMCMTEKYKQSNNCRAEAEYAFQKNKPIIPLIMQKDYQPDGWLGFILGSKIFIHFMKYDFEECIRRLKSELKAIYTGDKTRIDMINPDVQQLAVSTGTYGPSVEKIDPAVQERIDRHKRWTNKQVKEWLEKKSFHSAIISLCKTCDGKLLYEMHLIKIESPDFFFKAITKANHKILRQDVNLRDIALFNSELKALFSYK